MTVFIHETDGADEPTIWVLEGGDTDHYQYTHLFSRVDLDPDARRFWPDVVARMTGTTVVNEPLSAEQHEMRGAWAQPYDVLTHEYPPTREIAVATADALLRRVAIAMWDADDAARIADGEADMIMPRDNQQVMSEYLGHATAALAALTGAT